MIVIWSQLPSLPLPVSHLLCGALKDEHRCSKRQQQSAEGCTLRLSLYCWQRQKKRPAALGTGRETCRVSRKSEKRGPVTQKPSRNINSLLRAAPELCAFCSSIWEALSGFCFWAFHPFVLKQEVKFSLKLWPHSHKITPKNTHTSTNRRRDEQDPVSRDWCPHLSDKSSCLKVVWSKWLRTPCNQHHNHLKKPRDSVWLTFAFWTSCRQTRPVLLL